MAAAAAVGILSGGAANAQISPDTFTRYYSTANAIGGGDGNISSGYAIRFITKGGDATGMFVLSLALLPSYAAVPGILDGVATGYSGTPPREMTLNGRRALIFPQASPKTIIWQHRTFVVFLYGSDESAMSAYATGLITANQ